MRTLLLVFVIGAVAFPQAGSYRITDAREVVSERYGYAFRLPGERVTGTLSFSGEARQIEKGYPTPFLSP